MGSAFTLPLSTVLWFDLASHIEKGLIAQERLRKRVRDARRE